MGSLILLACALVNVPFMIYFGLHGEAWNELPSAVACGINVGLFLALCIDRMIQRGIW